MNWISQFLGTKPLVSLLDIAIVWFIIYRMIMYAQRTRAMNVLQGVAVIFVAKSISQAVGLQTIDWILNQIISWGVIALIILFQPELRRVLENLGRNLFTSRSSNRNPSEELIEDLETSLFYMSKRKIGALIAIEAEDPLEEFIASGIDLESEISSQLLINIFIPNTPLHDGAVVIRNFKIAAASCYLPLSESKTIPKELGTRHRAAIGLGEATDALILIVSEETGAISLVKHDFLHRDLDRQALRDLLMKYLYDENKADNDRDIWQYIKDFFTAERKPKGGSKHG